MNIVINILLTLTGLAYPLIWLWATEYNEWLNILPLIMAVLWGLKGLQAVEFQKKFAYTMAMLLGLVWLTRTNALMYWYPVIINGVMLVLFGSSLWAKQTFVERLARITEPDLPEAGVRYTRKVTRLWCGVFVFNIVITSALIFFGQLEWWAIYSGVISYVILALVMTAEWIVRQFVMRKY